MDKKTFIIAKSKNGILYKRYYNIIKDKNGLKKREFYYSQRLNLPQQLLYKFTSYYDPKPKRKTARKTGKVALFAAATLLAGAITLGGIAAIIDNTKQIPQETVITTQENTQQNTAPKQELKKPTPDTYVSNGTTFISLDSSLEISRYNYTNLVQELKKYNSSVPKNQQYDFDTTMFNHCIFTGVQIKESSLILYNEKDTSYKGGFKIGADALQEANEVAIKLTGKPIITDSSQLDDPILSNKACMYIYVKNYQYLKNYIDNNKLNIPITKPLVIDTYLFGYGNIRDELSGAGYTQKLYSMDILDYADIVEDFSDAIFEDKISGDQRDKARRSTFNKLYDVPNNNKKEIQEQEK